MTLLQNNVEAYTLGDAITINSGGSSYSDALTNVIINGGTVTADNTHPAHNSLSFKFAPVASQAQVIGWTSMSGTVASFRFYLYLSALPGVATTIVQFRNSGQVFGLAIGAAGTLNMLNADTTTTSGSIATSALPVNTMIRVEVQVTALSATAGAASYSYYTGDSTTAIETRTITTGNFGTTAYTECRFGKLTANAWATPFWLDDLAVQTSSAAALGPATTTVLPPTVNAGVDKTQQIASGAVALSDASAVAGSGGTITGVQWTQVSGPACTINNPTSITGATVSPPASGGTSVFRLTVTQTG